MEGGVGRAPRTDLSRGYTFYFLKELGDAFILGAVQIEVVFGI